MEEIKKITKLKLFDEVLKRLQELIFSLKGGDKLPGERELAKKLGVNRNIVREALKTLEVLRMVEIKHGLGIFVQKNDELLSIESNIYNIYSSGNINLKVLKDIMDARNVIEKHNIKLACLNYTQDDIDNLEKIIKKQKDLAFKNSYKSLEEGENFHLGIANAGKNKFLVQLLGTVFIITRTYRMQHVSTGKFNFSKDAKEHEMILNAIKIKNTELGQKIIEEHIREWQKEVIEMTGRDKINN